MEPKKAARVMQDQGSAPHKKAASRDTFGTFLGETPLDGVLARTQILTLDGTVSAMHLVPGSRIITRDCGMARLAAVDPISVEIATVTFRAGAFPALSDKDIEVVADQRIHLRGDAAAPFGRPAITLPARDLVDSEFVLLNAPRMARLIRLIFDRPHLIYADGFEAVSHLPRLRAAVA